MPDYQLPERCDTCPFFIQTFTQELKRRTQEGLKAVTVLTGICGVMRLSEIRAVVPAYETTHRRSGDSACYFSEEAHSALRPKVSWLIEKRKSVKSTK
ncbi:MAG: hypothetical protein KIY11_05455 [Thermoplasmata archaeon]|nr:hypothetical protein [Candidatus Sysuiplasma acidicola]MDH2905912.1 hypothetical protein [Methanomassiliicoccales archaeon]